MKSLFSQRFFIENRKALQQKLPDKHLVILTANGTLQRTADNTYPFTQDRNFWYLTGIDEPEYIVVLTHDSELLIRPETNPVYDVFNGGEDDATLQAISGITTILSNTEGWKYIRSQLRKNPHVHSIIPEAAYIEDARLYLNPARLRLIDALQASQPKVKLNDIRQEIASMRAIKQKPEIAAIRAAVDVTVETIADIRAHGLDTFAHEYELEAAITNGFRRRGATGHAYSPIVAAGKNATTLHYVANAGVMDVGALTVVDVGAEVVHYAADITRTIAKEPLNARQKQIYDSVLEIQNRAKSMLKPGVYLHDYEEAVSKHMAKALHKLGLISSTKDTVAMRKYYPHATSHFLGLDVHDVGDYNAPLQPNMVLTCEPGIYIPAEGIGIRIEDDILITESGNENLSANCSYEPYVI